MTILELCLLIILVFVLAIALRFICKRASLLQSILALKKTNGVFVEDVNYIAFFSPRITQKPAAIVRVGSRVFPVRIFSGKGGGHCVHLANEKYAATYVKSGGIVMVKHTPRGKVALVSDSRVYFPRTVILPAEDIAEDIKESKNSVIIFSPAPKELTYVTPAKTAIEVALTGDEVFGSRVFTKTTFINYVDRLSRDSALYWTSKRMK